MKYEGWPARGAIENGACRRCHPERSGAGALQAKGSLVELPIDIESMSRNAGPASDLLKAMGNSHRFLILCHLIRGECSVGQLEAEIGISQSSLSQHLARLKRDNLVAARRDGQGQVGFWGSRSTS